MKLRRKEVDRVQMGIQIFGGNNYPVAAYQTYRITYEDGSTEIDRGRTLHSLPGMSTSGSKMPEDVRPDLMAHMLAAQILLESISNACWRLDVPQPKKKRKKKRGK